MILKELSEVIGISGKEDAVRAIILKAIEGHVDSIRIDSMGSVLAVKKGTAENAQRVMIAAHMDEIGFMVTGIDGSGLLRFTNIGGIDDRILPGLRVKVGTQETPGVVIWTPIHKNRDQNVVKLSSLRIDIGASTKDGVAGAARTGDLVAFDSKFMELSDKVLRGKAFDDRVGCSLLVDVLQGGPYPVDILAAFTVQEEIGLRGAQVAAQSFTPDVAFVLEGTTANDIPNPAADDHDESESNPTTRMGAGPALTFMDRSMITNPRLLDFLRRTAAANDIPFQYKTLPGGGTDGGSIHLAAAGTATAVISMPCRYIHTPVAYLNRDDYAHTLKLIQTALHTVQPEHYRH